MGAPRAAGDALFPPGSGPREKQAVGAEARPARRRALCSARAGAPVPTH